MKRNKWIFFVFLCFGCENSPDLKYHHEGMHEWMDAREQHTAKMATNIPLPLRQEVPQKDMSALHYALRDWDSFALQHQIAYVLTGDSLFEAITKGKLHSSPVQIFIFPPHFQKLTHNPISLVSVPDPGHEALPQYATAPDHAVYLYRGTEGSIFRMIFNKGAWSEHHSLLLFMPRWGKGLGFFREEELGRRFWMQGDDYRVFLPQDPYGYLNRQFPSWREEMEGEKAPKGVSELNVVRLKEKLDPLFEQMTPESVMGDLRPVPVVPKPSPSPSATPSPAPSETPLTQMNGVPQ